MTAFLDIRQERRKNCIKTVTFVVLYCLLSDGIPVVLPLLLVQEVWLEWGV